MKIIYMSTTLGLIHEQNPIEAQEILAKGEVKELETGFKYVVITEEL